MKLSNFNNSFNNLNAFDKSKKNQMRFTNQNQINFSGNINSIPAMLQGIFSKKMMLDDKVIKRITKLRGADAAQAINILKGQKPEEIVSAIDKALGKHDRNTGYFTHLMQEANISSIDKIEDYTYKEGFLEVFKSFLDIVNFISDKILHKGAVFKGRVTEKQRIKNINAVREILEFYLDSIGNSIQSKNTSNNTKNTIITKDTLNYAFEKKVAGEISNPVKGYSSRDERTLNRIVTSLVSACFSATDFYNIAMLQSDDPKDAKKAKNKRFLQELSRLSLSAGFTFFTLGALEKFTKASVARNVAVIALSQIVADVISRLANGVHLKWLTPEEAKEIALNEKNKKNKASAQQTNTQTQQKTNNKTSFQRNLKTADEKLYQNFVGNPAKKSAIDIMMDNIAIQNNPNADSGQKDYKEKFKKTFKDAFKKISSSPVAMSIVITFVASNVVYLVANTKSGKDFKLGKLIENLKNLRDSITKKEVHLNLDEVAQKIEILQKNASNADEVETILNRYKDFIQDIIEEATNSSNKQKPKKSFEYIDGKPILKIKIDKPLQKGIYDGFTKLPKMFYDIFTTPAKIFLFLAGNKAEKSSSAEKIALNVFNSTFNKRLKTQADQNNPQKLMETIKEIKDNTRNLKVSNQNTGDLASLSRAIITLVTSYFFIGDHRNKVLIESEGKDIEGAKVEARTRAAHKLTNFIINGTLMNLGNSIFAKQLNSNLGWATVIPFFTEILNESSIRKCICQPMKKMKSREEIIEYETSRMERKGLAGWWTRTFKKLTGKKSLVEKTGVDKQA